MSDTITHFILVCTLSLACSLDSDANFIPVCTMSPFSSSDIVTDLPLSLGGQFLKMENTHLKLKHYLQCQIK